MQNADKIGISKHHHSLIYCYQSEFAIAVQWIYLKLESRTISTHLHFGNTLPLWAEYHYHGHDLVSSLRRRRTVVLYFHGNKTCSPSRPNWIECMLMTMMTFKLSPPLLFLLQSALPAKLHVLRDPWRRKSQLFSGFLDLVIFLHHSPFKGELEISLLLLVPVINPNITPPNN